MFIGKFAQRSHPFRKLLHVSQTHLNSHGSSYVNMMNSMPTFSKFRNLISRHVLSYSVKACKAETSVNLCNGDTNMARNCERSYQVVVAATRDMGIGKDGKLPWNLPSDLRSFKELTMSTSVHGKRNAVIMGRRTWESIPPKYRPLPSRLNVVLTRAGKLEAAASREDLLVCNDLSLALKLLAEPPHSVSVEKVFIIGGGQILKEALNGPGCEAIHLTRVETDMECDTFIPQIDSLLFSPLFSSSQMVENDIRFSFVTYVRMSNSAEESCTPQSSACTFDRETAGIKALSLMKRHAELEYIKQIQDSIASGKCRR